MSIQPSSEESLNWKREESINLPMPESEGRLAIRRQDWKRLKSSIQRINNHSSTYSIIYSVLFGVSGSAGLTIIPIMWAKDLPSWVTPLYLCVCLFSFLSAVVFVMVDRRVSLMIQSDREEIIEEMSEIEGTFIRKKGDQGLVDITSGEAIKNPAVRNSEMGD